MRSRPRRLGVALAVLATILLGGACATWNNYRGDPRDVIGKPKPPRVRVTLADRSEWEVRAPSLVDDSLCGDFHLRRVRGEKKDVYLERHGIPAGSKTSWRSVPADSIRRLQQFTFDAGKAAVGLALGVGLMALLISSLDFELGPMESSGGSSNAGYSCPVVSSQTGAEWGDEGMLFAGAFHPALARSDRLVLAGARSESGRVRLRLAGQRGETEHVDGVSLLAVAAESAGAVAVTPNGRLVAVGGAVAPAAARDNFGRHVREALAEQDGLSWESSLRLRPADASPFDAVEVTFPRPAGAAQARLLVRGCDTFFQAVLLRRFVAAHGEGTQAWYDALARAESPERKEVGRVMRSGGLAIEAWDGAVWRPAGVLPSPGYGTSRAWTVPLGLDALPPDSIRVRLTSLPSAWLIDQVALDATPETPLAPVALPLLSAVRGADGADVATALAAIDGRDVTLETGDLLELSFDASALAPQARHVFVVEGAGWYRFLVPGTGEPDRALLAGVAGGPDDVARVVLAERERLRELAATTRAPEGARSRGGTR